MKKILFISSMLMASLSANMSSLLIIPRDAVVAIGIYGGSSTVLSGIEVDSTDITLDGKAYDIDKTEAFFGGYLGLQNSHYRFSISYDVNNNSDLRLERLLINFDYKIGAKDAFRPMIGFGVGASNSSYIIDGRDISQDKGVIALRGGTEYFINDHHSVEFLLEYAYMLDSGSGDAFYDDEFTTYDIKDQSNIILRIGYTFAF